MVKHDRWADGDILESFRKRTYREIEVQTGMRLTHTGSHFTGVVDAFTQGDHVVLVDKTGRTERFRALDGAFMHNGSRVALRAPTPPPSQTRTFTASGSVDTGPSRARVAAQSRIWVEGIHDAELIEKIWGDDLREEGIVVEPLHGADDLATAVAAFRPGPTRRLGVLLDHLVDGSKETRIARSVDRPNVLVRGHPYVDIWQAIKPSTIGIAAWPEVPRGTPWKEGIVAGLGLDIAPGPFWGRVLASVTSYRDVETPLVKAVEQLIDFVATPDGDD
jgi:hypothetical protein